MVGPDRESRTLFPTGMTPRRKKATTMTSSSSARPPLPGWIADHLRRYLDTGGVDGHLWNGVPTLLLTTTGRRSGESLTLPLIYGRDGDRYLIVASRGGAPKH